MDEKLRGKGDYSIEEIMSFSSRKDDWIQLESKLSEDYILDKIVIKDSPSQGWGLTIGLERILYAISILKENPYLLPFKFPRKK